MLTVACDIETERLVNPEKIHVICAENINGGERFTFVDPCNNPKDWVMFCRGVSHYVGHNFIAFDGPVINRLLPQQPIDMWHSVTDTLVVSRLLNFKQVNGNSLEAWGERLKFPKLPFQDFSTLTPEMVEYCRQDVRVTKKLYLHLLKYLESPLYNY